MSVLPPLYAGWMESVLSSQIPSESRATCDKCAMCAHGDERSGNGGWYFDPQVKCCSYLPELHNFLVGGVLADEDPALCAGRASVEARLAARVEVTPLGLGRPPIYNLLYSRAGGAFGRSRSLRCPHYVEEGEGGHCGIWRHRNSVCTTWFCKHERGIVGFKFWKTLLQLLSRVEAGLSRWCVLELDVGIKALGILFGQNAPGRQQPKLNAQQIDQVADLRTYRLLWGKWLDREREFYRECARLVADLSWEDVTRICGSDVLGLVRIVQEAFGQLTSSQDPEVVRLRSLQITGMSEDSVQVKTYSGYDPLRLPRKLLEVLPYLESQPVSEALQTIEREKGVRLSRDMIRKLVDFGLLTARPEEEQPDFGETHRLGES